MLVFLFEWSVLDPKANIRFVSPIYMFYVSQPCMFQRKYWLQNTVQNIECNYEAFPLFDKAPHISKVIWTHFDHALVSIDICDAIKQNESEVEKYNFWFFGIFYYGIV